MSSTSAKPPGNLLDELQATLSHGTVARRVEALRRVTDLFLNNAVDYSDEQIALFDDVFQCLMLHIEISAKALLSNRLAPVDTAPPLTIRALALDDIIEVAGPVLTQSSRLDDAALIEAARNKSQAHLLAISNRKSLSGAVTDVLVLRGNDEVVQSTVNNPGAEFTERGFTRLVNRAENDDDLATCVGLRPTLPRHLYLKLLAKASDTVRDRLEAANPGVEGKVAAGRAELDDPRLRPDGDAVVEQWGDFVVLPCDRCGGVLKPDVVFFGESVPPERVAVSYRVVDEAEVLLVAGSSLTVMSGLRFVRHAAKAGKPVAIINRGPTRGDELATVRIDGGTSETLVELAANL